jgi:hypothetical protein
MTNRASEQEVIMVPTPDGTDTWKPMAHKEIIDSLGVACKNHGLDIVSRDYSLGSAGNRMFGTWELDAGTSDTAFQLGFRNSHDKSMMLGITAGTSVFVCSNMMFSGDWIAFAMHTKGLNGGRMIQLADNAIGSVIPQIERLVEWQDSLHGVYVLERHFKVMVYDMVDAGVFSGGQIGNYLKCLEEEKAVRKGHAMDGTTSLYNVHGAATRLMRGWNLLRVADATKNLNMIADDYLTRLAA